MKRARLVALGLTLLAVIVLLASAVLGLRGRSPVGGDGSADEVDAAREAPERRIRVEVLNAAGIPRLAQRGTDRLRDAGFDVVHFGNARGFHADTTLVLDRVGDLDGAHAVARALGVRRVRAMPDSTLYLEVTVVLGKDWEP